MGARGPKPSPRMQPREPLAVEPPACLKLAGRSRTVYRELAGRLRTEGFSAMVDTRAVGLAAQGVALVERLQAEVDRLESLMLDHKPHPLLGELRAARGQLQSLLGALFMTPRSRSAARVTEEQFRQASLAGADDSGKARFFVHGRGA